jgi:electron transport complex protein RnfA
MFLKKKSPSVYKALGIYLPLITTNCAVLGVALTNVQDGYNFIECVASGFGTAVGYTIAIVLLAGIRSRINEKDLPRPLRGAPIVMIAAALMSIAFMGFGGLNL